MHSKIIQISKKPIPKDEWVDESQYCDWEAWFVPSIADYVSEVDEKYHKDLMKDLSNDAFSIDPETRILTVINRKKYFEPRYKEFLEAAKECSEADLDEFMSEFATDVSGAVWRLKTMFEDRYDLWFDDGGEYAGLHTIDSFMRYAKDGDKVYVGNLIDYHY